MSGDLVLVPPVDRPEALLRYRLLLAGRAFESALAACRRAFEGIVGAVARAVDSIRRAFAELIEWDAARRRKFAPACEHYGVARVSARQYPAYRRMLARAAR